MIKEELIKKYNLKIKELNKHNKLYHELSRPKISDAEYDSLRIEIKELEKKYNFLKKKNLTY